MNRPYNSSWGELQKLGAPLGAVFNATPCYLSNWDEPTVYLKFVRARETSHLVPGLGKVNSHSPVQSTGTGFSEDDTSVPAIAEAVERYSACIFRSEQFRIATANELAEEALDLDLIPRCSEAELSHSRCPLVKPDKNKPIRWVRGFSLLDGRLTYVPVVMAYSRTGYPTKAERVWLSTSTGCAAHTSYGTALLGALCELLERDMISVIWLQQLTLPEIEIDHVPNELRAAWEQAGQCLGDIEYRFFDATSDFGVPAVYAVQLARHNSRVHTLVACSAAITYATAVAKVIRDLAHLRFALQTPRRIPDDCNEFVDPLDGAAYMAHRDRSNAFAFLLESPLRHKLSDLKGFSGPREVLTHIVGVLRRKGLPAFAVDLSSDEALRAGIRVLRAIVPALQPLSFQPRARFLGHQRLYQLPRDLNYPAFSEDCLNPFPQPFA